MFLFGLILFATVSVCDISKNLDGCFIYQWRKDFSGCIFKCFMPLCHPLFVFWDPYNVNDSTLDVVLGASYIVLLYL